MFEYSFDKRSHFSGKDGQDTYAAWCKDMGINAESFPFKVKNFGTDRRGNKKSLNVVSWGFYQGSSGNYYVFVSYRSSDGKYTCAYHWDVDTDGLPTGSPRKNEWCN